MTKKEILFNLRKYYLNLPVSEMVTINESNGYYTLLDMFIESLPQNQKEEVSNIIGQLVDEYNPILDKIVEFAGQAGDALVNLTMLNI